MTRTPGDEDPFDDVFNGRTQMSTDPPGTVEHVDVHEYDDTLTVVADIPAVENEDIDLQCDGRTLAIRVPTETRSFVMRVDLPAYVNDQPASRSFNNGVLEVTLDREPDPANIGFQ